MRAVVLVCEGLAALRLTPGEWLVTVTDDGYWLDPQPRPQGYPQPVDGQRVEINVIEERFGPPETIERERHGRPR